MKEVLKANIEQQDILSKIMEAYDKQRLASIDKYFGMAFFYFNILIWLTLYIRIPTVKLKIPGKAFLKSESRTSVTFKL